MNFQERCVAIGFGSNYEGKLGIKDDKVARPVKLDHLGEVEHLDAWENTCTIEQCGNLFLNGDSGEKSHIIEEAKNGNQFVGCALCDGRSG